MNIINGKVVLFGGSDCPKGDVAITIDLVRDTEEYGRQFTAKPTAHHPQMESIVARKDSEKPILSLAACGFHQLALMSAVPTKVAAEFDVPQWAFRNTAIVSITEEVLKGASIHKRAILDDDAIANLQQFLVLYADAVWRIKNPLIVTINPVCEQVQEWEGKNWFLFGVAFIMSVEQEEWKKLYDLKAMEFAWATVVNESAQQAAETATEQALSRIKNPSNRTN